MNVLSLFDGLSCGQIALIESGIKFNKYYASEIDKHAIAQSKLNFPNMIHLGSVVDVNVSELEPIDLLIGGSPCQSFSFAGKRKGMATKCEIEITKLEQYLELKEQNFEFEGQSFLFWEYMRILTDIRKYNPNVKFLLENVEMGAKWERVLSEAIGVFGVHINSALVSAQNRKRIYWTNIKTRENGLFGELHSDIPQPKDRGILLRDILEKEVDEKYFISSDRIAYFNRKIEKGFLKQIESDVNKKSECLLATMYKQMQGFCVKDSLVKQINPSKESGGKQLYQQNRVYDSNGISPCLDTDSGRRNIIVHNTMPRSSKTGKGGTGPLSRNDGKTYCLDTGQTNAIEIQTSRIRRLTPTECARLQTIPDWYIWQCSDTQQYKMLGNGWTVEVIKHIFSFM